ncbi:MAG: hypothetical protein B1H11_09290 [Desulfobacteraceae bacterium 4484_190.1]|nr:MAG: hypothetical protein B1H11_09290 [Desulfobacteraceae bacterium 4484_190.1]
MSDHQEPTGSRESKGDEPIFLIGMIRVKESDTQCVPQDSSSFSESKLLGKQFHASLSLSSLWPGAIRIVSCLASFVKGANSAAIRNIFDILAL